MQKVRYLLAQGVGFLVKFPGFRRIFKNLGEFLKIRQSPGNFTKNETLWQGGSALFASTPFFEMKSADLKAKLALKWNFRFLEKNVFW